MAELRFRPEPSSAFIRQYGKLPDSDKQLADAAIRNLTAFVNMEDPNSEGAKQLARNLRVKIIQRFKSKRPRRMEATFSPDGRVVWALDGNVLRFIYLGNHSVLDKK